MLTVVYGQYEIAKGKKNNLTLEWVWLGWTAEWPHRLTQKALTLGHGETSC